MIERAASSYAGEGNNAVDKAVERTYSNKNQSLVVESHFVGNESVCSLLKRFLQEQAASENRVANAASTQDADSSNTAVAASAKEGGV